MVSSWRLTSNRGGLLALFAVLVIFHFDSIFGLYSNSYLVFGFWPIEFAYQAMMGLVHLGFFYILYRNWPKTDSTADATVRQEDE